MHSLSWALFWKCTGLFWKCTGLTHFSAHCLCSYWELFPSAFLAQSTESSTGWPRHTCNKSILHSCFCLKNIKISWVSFTPLENGWWTCLTSVFSGWNLISHCSSIPHQVRKAPGHSPAALTGSGVRWEHQCPSPAQIAVPWDAQLQGALQMFSCWGWAMGQLD